MEELRKEAERKHSHLGVPESWEEGRPEMEEERLKYRETEDHQGGWRESILTVNRWQRGRMGVREEVERRTGTAGAQRGRESETEKEVGKQIHQMKWKQLLCRCGRGLDPDEC